MKKSNKSKPIFTAFIVSVMAITIISALSAGVVNPDYLQGFQWVNSTIGINTMNVYIGGTNYTDNIVSGVGAGNVTVRKNGGADIGTQGRLNFIEGDNVSLTIADDPANNEIDITITSTAAAGAGGTLGSVNNSYSPYDFRVIIDGSDFLAINITGGVEFNTTSAYTTLQSAANATSEDASGDLVYNTTLRVKPYGAIKVGSGVFPLGANTLKLVNHLALVGSGASSTRITNNLLDGGVIANMWNNFTYDSKIIGMSLQGLNGGGDEGIVWYAQDTTMPTLDGSTLDTHSGMLEIRNVRIFDCYNPVNITTITGNNGGIRVYNVFSSGRWFLYRIIDSKITHVMCDQLNLTKITDNYFGDIYVMSGRVFIKGGTQTYPCKGNEYVGFRSDNPSSTPCLTIMDYAYSNTFSASAFTNLRNGSPTNVTSCIVLGGNTNRTTITGSFIGNTISRALTPAQWNYLIYEESGTNNNTFVGNEYGLGSFHYGGRDAIYSEDGANNDSNYENRRETFRASAGDSISQTTQYIPLEGLHSCGTTFNLRAIPVEKSGYFADLRVYKYNAVPAGEWQNITLSHENSLTGGAVTDSTLIVNLSAGTSTGTDTGNYYYDSGARPDLVGYKIDSTDGSNAGGINCIVDFYPDLEDHLLSTNT